MSRSKPYTKAYNLMRNLKDTPWLLRSHSYRMSAIHPCELLEVPYVNAITLESSLKGYKEDNSFKKYVLAELRYATFATLRYYVQPSKGCVIEQCFIVLILRLFSFRCRQEIANPHSSSSRWLFK
ncbi:hypothetical protein K469DRAFT_714061 [Zopfia rhizophila CBS 207.26]|uniref:Uncharacterized protein n=1 Tax=Zopfia rhizophila CBS 207.26 TaxID=1314779 RepID=A0A6A6DRF9_9PEZI|nr:hypothetical protein K469DRAFT_714061 [Zopfia rhizophila CBS 207.26]